MPSTLRLRLDGWFSRFRGQSSGNSASEEVPAKLRALLKRCSRDVQKEPRESRAKRQESQERHEPRGRFVIRTLFFNSPIFPCPRAACRIRLSVWGGAPPMSRLAGLELLGDVMSHYFWEGYTLSIFIHV